MKKKFFVYDEYFKFKTMDICFIASTNIMAFCSGIFLTFAAIKEINIGYVIVAVIFVTMIIIENIKWLKSYINLEKRKTHNILLIKLQELSKEIYKEDKK